MEMCKSNQSIKLSWERVEIQKSSKSPKRRGAGTVIVFGGDGTNRELLKVGLIFPAATLCRTNNVFPFHMEATVGGIAAGLVAKKIVPLKSSRASQSNKR
ncbi:MAG: hypothetical protein CM15mP49_33480 [Actinomycetota bacterium]|nr:MAG: hypothetical protein CM15mP49_33480 [Actinomycetota bacterium]